MPASSAAARSPRGKSDRPERARAVPLSPIELRDIAARVLPPEMRQDDIAEIFDVHSRTLRRWLKGDAVINGSATVLLRLLRAGRISLADARAALAQSPDMPREENP